MTVVKIVVEIEGLEPSLTEPESVVLPLHHISIWLPFLILGLQRYECFVKMQNFLQYFAHFVNKSTVCQCKAPRRGGRFRAGR